MWYRLLFKVLDPFVAWRMRRTAGTDAWYFWGSLQLWYEDHEEWLARRS